MFAGKYKLHNITAILDRNNIQIDGNTEDIMPLENLRAKYEAFGWHVLEVDGHNHQEIIDACMEAKAIYEKPTIVIAHTIPGKGVDFMEGDYRWHSKAFTKPEAKKALHELRTLQDQVISEHQYYVFISVCKIKRSFVPGRCLGDGAYAQWLWYGPRYSGGEK